MQRFIAVLGLAAAVSLTAACARSSRLSTPAPEPTVLKVENRGFPDMNVFVLPDAGNRMRLGTVTGNSTSYFMVPDYLVRTTRELRFQALPIATPRGPISESILVTPGDTVVLIIPP